MGFAHPQKGLSLVTLSASLPADLAQAVAAARQSWGAAGATARLWKQDASLWTNSNESQWLGWLTIVEHQLTGVSRFKALAAEIAEDGFTHFVLLGMADQAYALKCLASPLENRPTHPNCWFWIPTDPAQIRALRAKIDLARTLFCVSSKSGTTIEPNIYLQYFHEETREIAGDCPGSISLR